MTSGIGGILNKFKNFIVENIDKEEEEYEEEEDTIEDNGEDINIDEIDVSLSSSDDEALPLNSDSTVEQGEKYDTELFKKYKPIQIGIQKAAKLYPSIDIESNPDLLISHIEAQLKRYKQITSSRDQLNLLLDAQRSFDSTDQDLRSTQNQLINIQTINATLQHEKEKILQLKTSETTKKAELQDFIDKNKEALSELERFIKTVENDIKIESNEISAQRNVLDKKMALNSEIENTINGLKSTISQSKFQNDELELKIEEEQEKLNQLISQIDFIRNETITQSKDYEEDELHTLLEKCDISTSELNTLQDQIKKQCNGKTLAELEKQLSELNETYKRLAGNTGRDCKRIEKEDERFEITEMLVLHFKGNETDETRQNIAHYFGWTENELESLNEEKIGFWGRGSRVLSAIRDSWKKWLLSAASE